MIFGFIPLSSSEKILLGMGLYKKIEGIRQKPEHIRMRFVWAMVTISMLLVIMIWFFSLKNEQQKDALIPADLGNSDIVNQLKEQKDSLQNATQGFSNAIQQQNQ